jgi:prolyl-tRNA synthetase
MLEAYADFAINDAAIPVIQGLKSEMERFAGAQETYTIEAMMGDGKALQSGTSHHLGQNFAKAFDIQYLDGNNQLQHCWTTSWGLSTRMIGAIIMTHGDDNGLVMPPKLAPYQTVIVPIYRKDEEKTAVMAAVARISAELKAADIRIKIDDRENLSPGYKFNDWEMRGVPTRIEIGPRDVAKNSVALARRDIPSREGKQFVSQDGLAQTVTALLAEIQQAMLDKAARFQDQNTHDVTNYDQFKDATQTGYARGWWAGTSEEEAAVKEETKATLRCFPIDQPDESGVCFYTGRPANRIAIFGRAY